MAPEHLPEGRERRPAQGALESFRTKPPRLVFLDLMMPKRSGFELFTYLRGVHLVDAWTRGRVDAWTRGRWWR